jgi:indole-3-glycerol phosphate synthase
LPTRNFYGAVTVPRRGGPNLIAEVKRSSPSAGLIQADFDPLRLARQYAEGGAQALSVLTDEKYFGGRLEHIERIKLEVGLPVLRKDFLIDPYQVHESRACGADAVLLIADALEASEVTELVKLSRGLGLWVLVEVHTRESLFSVLQILDVTSREGVLLGINNRDLQAQRVDLGTTEQLARFVPPGLPIVAESGVRTRQDVERMHAAGARALLVGETLMRSGDPRRRIRELFG